MCILVLIIHVCIYISIYISYIYIYIYIYSICRSWPQRDNSHLFATGCSDLSSKLKCFAHSVTGNPGLGLPTNLQRLGPLPRTNGPPHCLGPKQQIKRSREDLLICCFSWIRGVEIETQAYKLYLWIHSFGLKSQNHKACAHGSICLSAFSRFLACLLFSFLARSLSVSPRHARVHTLMFNDARDRLARSFANGVYMYRYIRIYTYILTYIYM